MADANVSKNALQNVKEVLQAFQINIDKINDNIERFSQTSYYNLSLN